MPSWGQWIAAFASTYTVVANILPFFLVMVLLFNGVLIPYCIPALGVTDSSSTHGFLEVYNVLYFPGYISHRRGSICGFKQGSSCLWSLGIGSFQSARCTNMWRIHLWLSQIFTGISSQSWCHHWLSILLIKRSHRGTFPLLWSNKSIWLHWIYTYLTNGEILVFLLVSRCRIGSSFMWWFTSFVTGAFRIWIRSGAYGRRSKPVLAVSRLVWSLMYWVK